MPWSDRFRHPWGLAVEEPITLPDGRRLVTLEDAGRYVTTLPARIHATAPWQNAAAELIRAADLGGPWLMFARASMMTAIHGQAPRPERRAATEPAWKQRRRARRAGT